MHHGQELLEALAQIPGRICQRVLHSDGLRGINRVRSRLADGGTWYEYPRYLFTNESGAILRLSGEVSDRLGVAWRFSRNAIPVARATSASLVSPGLQARADA